MKAKLPAVLSFLMLGLTTTLAQAPRQSVNADDGNWLTYSGSYQSQRFSRLSQITPANVGRLRPVWVYQPPGTGALESTPVVVNGVMYVTAGPTTVVALELRSGRPLWEWSRPIAPSVLNHA